MLHNESSLFCRQSDPTHGVPGGGWGGYFKRNLQGEWPKKQEPCGRWEDLGVLTSDAACPDPCTHLPATSSAQVICWLKQHSPPHSLPCPGPSSGPLLSEGPVLNAQRSPQEAAVGKIGKTMGSHAWETVCIPSERWYLAPGQITTRGPGVRGVSSGFSACCMGPGNGEVTSKMLSSTQAAGLTCPHGIHPEGNREGLENRQGV